MTIAIQALLGLLEQLLPLLGAGSNVLLIEKIIGTLAQFLPFILQEISALAGPVKNIIAALSANPATNATQLATLQTMDAQVDAAFDAAAADTAT